MNSVHRVIYSPELLDKIFGYLDVKTAIQARTVCRKWRSVSEFYLKRRLGFCEVGRSQLTKKIQRKIMKANAAVLEHNMYNSFQLPLNEFEIEVASDRTEFSRSENYLDRCPTPFIPIILGVDWSSNLVHLILLNCLTLQCWMTVGLAVLKKMKTLVSINVSLREDTVSSVIPLCYTELRDQCDAEDEKNERLRRFEITFSEKSIPSNLSGRLDGIVRDVFTLCSCLDTYSLTVSPRVRAIMAQCTCPNHAQAGVTSCWQADVTIFWQPQQFNAHVFQAVSALLNVTKPRILSSILNHGLLSLAQKEPFAIDQLEVVYLSHILECQLETLLSLPAFTNVKCLHWSFDLHGYEDHLKSLSIKETIFPNLRALQLTRGYGLCSNDSRGEFPIDSWIRSSFHKIAPHVERLVVNVHTPLDWQKGRNFEAVRQDCLNMLRIAKSFGQLNHLVLVVNQNSGTRNCTYLKMNEVVQCLQGLTSLTLAFKIPTQLYTYADFFLKACNQKNAHSVQKLGLYVLQNEWALPGNTPDGVDLSRLKVPVPEHLELVTGIWTKQVEMETLVDPTD